VLLTAHQMKSTATKPLLVIVACAGAVTAFVWTLRRRTAQSALASHEHVDRPADDPIASTLQLAKQLRDAHITSVAEAEDFAAGLHQLHSRDGLGLAVFPGSFNPPSCMHQEIARQVMAIDGVSALWLDMTIHRTKKLYLDKIKDDRFAMTELAAADIPGTAVTTLMANMGDKGWTSEYFHVLRKLAGNNSRVYWVMGSDVVEDMMYYGEKATGLLAAVDFVVVFERQVHECSRVLEILQKVTGWPIERLSQFVIFRKLGDYNEGVSSTNIRRMLHELHGQLPLSVLRHIVSSPALLSFYEDLANSSPRLSPQKKVQPSLPSTIGESIDDGSATGTEPSELGI